MKKISAKLESGIAGPGFVLRRGFYTGDLDESGILWLDVQPTNRIPGDRVAGRRIGVPAARFSYLEEPGSAPSSAIDKRAEVNEQIKAANKAREARAAKA